MLSRPLDGAKVTWTAPLQTANETAGGSRITMGGLLIQLGGDTQQAAIVSGDTQGCEVRQSRLGRSSPETGRRNQAAAVAAAILIKVISKSVRWRIIRACARIGIIVFDAGAKHGRTAW